MITPVKRGHIEPAAMRWGPFICMVVGGLFIMFDLTRHVVLDFGGPEELAMYDFTGELSTVGFIGLMLSWIGVFIFATGIMWFAEIPSKLSELWTSYAASKGW